MEINAHAWNSFPLPQFSMNRKMQLKINLRSDACSCFTVYSSSTSYLSHLTVNHHLFYNSIIIMCKTWSITDSHWLYKLATSQFRLKLKDYW